MSSPRTTFGSPMALADDANIARALALAAWPNFHPSLGELTRAVERDLALTDRRWRGAEPSASGDFVPGDVLRLRALTATWLLDLAGSDWSTAEGTPPPLPTCDREVSLVQLLHAAVPYFLPAGPASASSGADRPTSPSWDTSSSPTPRSPSTSADRSSTRREIVRRARFLRAHHQVLRDLAARGNTGMHPSVVAKTVIVLDTGRHDRTDGGFHGATRRSATPPRGSY